MYLIIYKFKNSKKNRFLANETYWEYAKNLKDAKSNSNVEIVWHGELN